MINFKKLVCAAACFAALGTAFVVTSCGSIPIVSEVQGTEGYTDTQTMLVIATERNRYREIYTDQIWEVEVRDDGTRFQDYLLGEIRGFLGELRTMNLMADQEKMTLTGQEKELLRKLSEEYYASLTEADRAYIGADAEDVYTMYEAYHRANKLVNELTKDVNMEISDSEAKVITLQEIRVGNEADAQAAYARVTEENADFAGVARAASEDKVIEKSVGRGERDTAYEDVVFSLEKGQISPVFQVGDAWYIVKCVNDYDEEATLERKQKLAFQRKEQAFRRIYDQFAAAHPVEIGGAVWDRISFTDGADSTTTDFFERYQETMGQ